MKLLLADVGAVYCKSKISNSRQVVERKLDLRSSIGRKKNIFFLKNLGRGVHFGNRKDLNNFIILKQIFSMDLLVANDGIHCIVYKETIAR